MEPHSAQKKLVICSPESAVFVYSLGLPDVTLKVSSGINAFTLKALPEIFWQSEQWQRTFFGREVRMGLIKSGGFEGRWREGRQLGEGERLEKE